MKKKIYAIIALSMMVAMFSSCENDAPEINFTQTDNHVSDFSGIIKAINDQTTSLDEKLALIEAAITNQTLTFSQKIDILNAAVENGVLKLEEMAAQLVAAIEAQTAGLNEKLALIEQAINNQALSIETKLDLLNTSVKQGFLDEKNALDLMRTAILEYLQTLNETIATGDENIVKAIEALQADNGIYRNANDPNAVYLNPDVWAAIKGDTQLNKALQTTVPMTTPTVTTSQNSAHESCIITITNMGFSTPVLIENWDRTSGTAGENQELVRVINLATTATYSIDKGGCSLGLYEVYVTDALGSNRLYSNFNGVASGSVQLTFNKDGHVVTSGHVNVNMR